MQLIPYHTLILTYRLRLPLSPYPVYELTSTGIPSLPLKPQSLDSLRETLLASFIQHD